MSAQLVVESLLPFHGLRPLDPRRDLSQVADLIEEAFGGELEPGGIAALRDLRMLSRMGPLVGLVARSDPAMEDVLGGFVWIEEDQVVGNVTLQRMDSYGSRWQIANVAVTKAFQGRGIARALVQAALERIRERHGDWAVLQVRMDNAIAQGLYDRLGFEPLTRETLLHLERLQGIRPPAAGPDGFRPYRREEWQALYDLQAASRTALASWWRPVRSREFWQSTESRLAERFWELLGRNRIRRWVVAGRNGLAAWLSIDARRWQGIHRLDFAVHPACRGELERQLVRFALAFLNDCPRWPIRVEHSGEHQEMLEALQEAGFGVIRDHLSMRKKISSA